MDDLTNRTLVKVELGKDANPFNLGGCVVGHMCQLLSYLLLGQEQVPYGVLISRYIVKLITA